MSGLQAGNGHAHPLVCELFDTMRRKHIPVTELARKVGVHRKAFWNWRERSTPTLAVFIATANALGYEVVLTPRQENKAA